MIGLPKEDVKAVPWFRKYNWIPAFAGTTILGAHREYRHSRASGNPPKVDPCFRGGDESCDFYAYEGSAGP